MKLRKEKKKDQINSKSRTKSKETAPKHSERPQIISQELDNPNKDLDLNKQHQNLFLPPADDAFQPDKLVVNEENYFSPNFPVISAA